MNDSYSATRIQVMRTKLIKSSEYERLLKMSEAEVLAYLQATEYKQDIDAMALKDLEDLEIIDKVLARSVDRVLLKLQRITSDDFRTTLNLFLAQNDLWNLKIIAESLSTGNNPGLMLKKYKKQGTFDPELYAQAKSIGDLSKLASRKVPSLRKHPMTLPQFLDALTSVSPASAALIDEQNILRLLMQKREKIPPENIAARMLPGGALSRGILRTAASAQTFEETLKMLRTTTYGKAFSSSSMTEIEPALHHQVIRNVRKAAGIYPLSTDVLIRYLMEREREISNLRLIIKGKHLGLEEQFLREQLVI